MLYNLANADLILFTALSPDGALQIFNVSPSADGVTLKCCNTFDGRRAGDLAIDNAFVPAEGLVVSGQAAEEVFSNVINEAYVAISAELVGGMRRMLRETATYLQERRQFGASLSSFQVLQHALTDMFIALETSRSLVMAAAIKVRDNAPDRSKFAAAARLRATRAARSVGEAAIQLHGAIATTEEFCVGHFLKRAVVLEQLLGGEALARYRFASGGLMQSNLGEEA